MKGQLQGYRLRQDIYELITDNHSELLGFRLQVEGELIGFYREDTGEKLLNPTEVSDALRTRSTAKDRCRSLSSTASRRAGRAVEATFAITSGGRVRHQLRWAVTPSLGVDLEQIE